ncbi:transmembrane protein, putative [Bodo saltans]|uniref:Transmembrane protein, putative n=1 Tax=Bodo saltans TaxID=75058 RepID=A0A0S4J9I0_BODSA|nr:transmembrane protein, putative [Bodo saltans]|eukprot:CUG88033.1 transmembrane protein, putative [Bodo saltans]
MWRVLSPPSGTCTSWGVKTAVSNKTVSVRLLNSPTQVIVSDNATLLPPALTSASSLAGCTVSVTFTSNTTVPPAGLLSSHVYVATASHLRSVSVLLQATLFLEGYFLTIGGNGSGTIGHALVAADPSSSVVCRRSTVAVCSVTLGTSLLHLARGCPPISAASVSLNGTNVTGAMWPSINVFGTDVVPASTFALIAVDNSSYSLPTASTLDVILESIQGTVIGINGFLTASRYDSQTATYVYSSFPAFNGTVLVQNSSLLGSTSTLSIFQLTGVLFLSLHLIGVNSTGAVIYVTPSIAEATRISINVVGCFVASTSGPFATLSYVDGAPSSHVPLYKISIINTYVDLSNSGSGIKIQSSVSTRIQIVVTTSVVLLGNNAAYLFQLMPNGASGISFVRPILNGSTLQFRGVQFVQQWIYFTTLAEFTVASAISVYGVVNSTIEFNSCTFTTQQLIASHTSNPPPALLLAVSGSFNLSTLLWYDTITQVLPIGTGAEVLQPPALTIGYINSSLLQFRDSTFTNFLAVGQLTQPSESTLNSNATIDIGCNTRWCKTFNASNTLSSSCALITPQTFCNDTDIPPWITFTVLNSTCTLQTTLTGSMSTPNSLTKSATVGNTRGPTVNITATQRSAAHHGLSSSLSNTNVRTQSQSDSSLYTSPTATILPIAFAASPPEQPVVVQAVVVGAVAPLAGGVLSTSAAGVIQRSNVALRFSNCAWSAAAPPSASPQQTTTRGQYMSVSENPTRLAFGPDEGAMYRGGAVGNMILLVVVCLLVVPVGLIHFHVTKAKSIEKGNAASLGHSLGALRLPGRALVPFSVLLQPTVTAAAGLLMVSSTSSPSDIVTSVVVLCILCLIAAWPAWAVLRGCRLLGNQRVTAAAGLLMVSSTSSPSDIVTSVVVLCILCLIAAWPAWAVLRGCRLLVTAVDVPFVGGVKDYIAGRRVAWVPRPSLPQKSTNNIKLGDSRTWLLDHSVSGAECFALQFDPLIGRVHSGVFRELYVLTGYVWSVATGIVAALSPDDPSSCRIAQIALIVIPAASLASLVIIHPFASPSTVTSTSYLELLSLLMAIMALVDEGSSAVGLSYAMITLSLAVSLLRVITRVQLNLSWKQKKKDTSNSNTTATTTVGSEFVSSRRSLGAPYNPINAAVMFLNDDDFEHSAPPYRPPHPLGRPSIARLARIQYIVGTAVGAGRDDDGTTRAKGPSPLSHESEAHIIQDMLDAVQRHRRLEAAIGFQKRSTSSGRQEGGEEEVVLFTLPPRMQQDHLIKLISIASKYSE